MKSIWIICHCQIDVASHPVYIFSLHPIIIISFRFCQTRWVEDYPVADHALEVWPTVLKVIKQREGLCKSSRPSIKSYQVVLNYYTNKLIPCKLQFFSFIASIFQPYLEIFQTYSPILPFMYKELKTFFTTLLGLICKPDAIPNDKKISRSQVKSSSTTSRTFQILFKWTLAQLLLKTFKLPQEKSTLFLMIAELLW